MEIITKAKVLAWTKQHRGSDRTNVECVYTRDYETPNCIIANFLADEVPKTWAWVFANVDKEYTSPDGNGTIVLNYSVFDDLVTQFPPQLVSLTPAAIKALRSIQSAADDSGSSSNGITYPTWGEAIQKSLKTT